MRTDTLDQLRYCLRHPRVLQGLFALGTLLVFSLLVLAGWWGPARLAYTDAAEQYAGKRMQWREVQQTAGIVEAYQQAQVEVEQMEKKLSADMNQGQAVQMLSKLAAGQKVRIVSQAFDTEHKQAQVEVMYVDLVLQGSYRAIRGMLVELAKAPVWAEATELHLERALNDESVIKCRVSLAIYHAAQRAPEGN